MPKSTLVKELDQIQATAFVGLEPLGFKVKGRTFNRETSDGLIQVINFQKDRNGARFSINLGIYVPEVAKLLDKAATGGWVQEYLCDIRDRIGCNGIDGTDMWWTIRAPETVGPKIWLRLESQAIPHLDRYATRDLILDEMSQDLDWGRSGESPKLIRAILYNEKGQRSVARALLLELLAECKSPAQEEYVHELSRSMSVLL